MRIAGIILAVIGLLAALISIINYIRQTDKFGFFGFDVTITTGSVIPMVLSVFILFLGIIIIAASNRSKKV